MALPTPALPSRIRGWTAWAGTMASVLLWRWGPFPMACVGGGLAIVLCWQTGPWLHGDRRWLTAWAVLPLGVALVLAAARVHPAWWPCDVGCAGGGAYAQVGRFSLPLLAAMGWGLVSVMVAATRWRPPQMEHQRSAPTPRYCELWAWLLIGASLTMLAIAWKLRLPCKACGAYHTAALAVVAPLRAGRLRLLPRSAAVLAGMALPLCVFGIHLRRDEPPLPPPATLVSPPDAWREQALAGGRWGLAQAPRMLVVAIDFQCPDCAQALADAEPVIDRAVSDGTLAWSVHPIIRRSEPASAALAGWWEAAAVTGRGRRALDALLGSSPTATPEELLHGPAATLLDLPALAAAAHDHADACTQLQAGDRRLLEGLGYAGRTPFAVLQDAASGAVLARWSGALPAAALAQALTPPPPDHGGTP